MAFKENATAAAGNIITKKYFMLAADRGDAGRVWRYVTADTPGAVENSGYINSTNAPNLIRMIQEGDLIEWVRVNSISDTRTIRDDIAAGVADFAWMMVLVNTGTIVDLSPILTGPEAETMSYTGP